MNRRITVREVRLADKALFLKAMQVSKALHYPWVETPLTSQAFDEFWLKSQKPTHKSYLVCDELDNMVGVFNISEIIRGVFQNGYLGYYGLQEFTGMGLMSSGLKLVLKEVFTGLKLHRLEANIQPDNTRSIQLVKSNGFRCEGYSPNYLKIMGEWRGHEHWVMTEEDYLQFIEKTAICE